MTAADIMTKPALSTSPEAGAADIGRQMAANRISGVPVLDGSGALVGIITEADLLRAHGEGRSLDELTVADLMTREVVTVAPDTPLEDLVAGLQAEDVLRVPVLERGRLVGIVSRGDLLRAIFEPPL